DLSLVIYLNEDFQAGETRFPDQSLSLRPVAGEGLLFRHSLRHEGTAVQHGRKYIVRTSVAVSQPAPGGLRAAPGRVSLLSVPPSAFLAETTSAADRGSGSIRARTVVIGSAGRLHRIGQTCCRADAARRRRTARQATGRPPAQNRTPAPTESES